MVNWQVVAIFAPIITAAVSWYLTRALTGKKHFEDAESVEQTLRIKQLLDAEGMTLADAWALKAEYRRGHGTVGLAYAHAVVAKEKEALRATEGEEISDLDPEYNPMRDTTMAIGERLRAEYERADAALNFEVVQFRQNSTPARAESLVKVQEAWQAFREAEGRFASLMFEGGTAAPLAGCARMIELTEARMRDLELAKAEQDL
ncbi:lysozyme inhibitor LprI family protein [Croceicoccus marinus]|uniref:Lysozyme inhibitor LprI-like N-terminal domain-containing protein n=1 Tax=Croceicoccus marinus TaxID=450378 RepID=A0A1Z1FAK2_9SPHN|nr:lysozyme inhibitor LprI family protein [Croceicoccus marinus]ARU15763.1 hypothetical protein A9D14_05685 [Croceicoccus marinus]